MVLYLGWADIALSTVLVEGPDESLTYRAKSNRRRRRYKTFQHNFKRIHIVCMFLQLGIQQTMWR